MGSDRVEAIGKLGEIARIEKLSDKQAKYDVGVDYSVIREHYKAVRSKVDTKKEALFDCVIQFKRDFRQIRRIVFGK